MLAIALSFFILGTLVGSFLNVLILRHGFNEDRRSRSGCGACGATLAWYELVPVLSFFFLRGKCHSCGSALLLQYPLVEIITGALFTISFLTFHPLQTLSEWLFLLIFLMFWSTFIVLTVYDLKHTLIPYVFSLTLIGMGVMYRLLEALVLMESAPLLDGLFGGLIFGGFLLSLFLVTRGKGMGLGDAYIGAALGILFGVVGSLEVILISFWIGAGVGIVLLVLKKGFKMKSEVPFVPFLFIGAVIGAFTHWSPVALIGRLVYGF